MGASTQSAWGNVFDTEMVVQHFNASYDIEILRDSLAANIVVWLAISVLNWVMGLNINVEYWFNKHGNTQSMLCLQTVVYH